MRPLWRNVLVRTNLLCMYFPLKCLLCLHSIYQSYLDGNKLVALSSSQRFDC